MRHRTAIITAASIALVMAAATAAIATNLGILDSATEASDVGTLTIETIEAIPTAAVAVIEAPPAEIVVVEDASGNGSAESSDSIANGELAAYAVGDAGIVTLKNDGMTLAIGDIETNPGWTTTEVIEGASIDIKFASTEGGSLQFTAHLDDFGNIVTAVDDLTAPAIIVVTETVYEDDDSAASGSAGSDLESSATTSSSDEYDDDEYDDDEYEDDENEGEEDEEDEEDEDDD